MEDVEFLLAFLGGLSRDNTKVSNMLLEASSDIWLALKLGGRIDAHILDDLERLGRSCDSLLSSTFRRHDVLFGHISGSSALRLVGLVELLVLLDVLHQLDRIQHAATRKFVEFPLPSTEHELLFLDGQFLASVDHN